MTTTSTSIWTIIGGGQMGRALVAGMIDAGILTPAQLRLVEPHPASQTWWSQHHPEIVIGALASSVADADVVMLAVKPNIVPEVLSTELDLWRGKLIVSIAAGVSLAKLADGCGHQRVIRVMPNTPSLVGQGASAFCCGAEVSEQDQIVVSEAFSAVGLSIQVDESQMDAVTGLSGSGPAYVCLAIEALADGGVSAGLPRALAMQLATQTVLGTAKMIQQTGRHPAELKDAVASPGGTTIAGLRTLEQNGVRGGLIAAVNASAARSKELG